MDTVTLVLVTNTRCCHVYAGLLQGQRKQLFKETKACTARSLRMCRSPFDNKKQCSRQLQCEVPCGVGNVMNSSLFIFSSLSSLFSTSYAVRVCVWRGGGLATGGLGGGGRGHFYPAAIYCTTTWCFALKGLRTSTRWWKYE